MSWKLAKKNFFTQGLARYSNFENCRFCLILTQWLLVILFHFMIINSTFYDYYRLLKLAGTLYEGYQCQRGHVCFRGNQAKCQRQRCFFCRLHLNSGSLFIDEKTYMLRSLPKRLQMTQQMRVHKQKSFLGLSLEAAQTFISKNKN